MTKTIERGAVVEGRVPSGRIRGRVCATWSEERMGRTVPMAEVAWFGGIGRGAWPVADLEIVGVK